jgi:hypothetical protein
MGGSDSIRGFLVQTVVCLLDVLQSDHKWQTVTLEPNQGNTQIDFIWQYETKKKIVQVKSSGKFDQGKARKAAEELERLEADEYELILAGYNFGTVRQEQKFGEVLVKLVNLDASNLKVYAMHLLEMYLIDKGYPVTSLIFRKMAVAVLIEHILSESVYSRTLSREDLDDLIMVWLLPVLNAQMLTDVAQEAKEMGEFKAQFRVDEPNIAIRKAVMDFYHRTSLKNKHLMIRDAIQYLIADERGRLTLRIEWWEYFFNCFFIMWTAILMLLPLAATPILFHVENSTFFFLILLSCTGSWGLGFLFLHIVNPFIQALRIQREINRLE